MILVTFRPTRGLLLAISLALSAGVMLAPFADSTAIAAKKKKGKGKKGKGGKGDKGDDEEDEGPKKAIKREEALAPKKDVQLDETLKQTRDLKSDVDQSKRPSLTPDQLKAAETEGLLDEKLDEEIKLARQLIDLEPSCEGQSKVRSRLAELYWEKSKRAFFKSNDPNVPANSQVRFQGLMKKLQDETVANYRNVLETCPGYSDTARTLYNTGRSLVELDRASDAAEYFKRVIKEYESSEWVPHSWFMVGEVFFNNDNDAPKALKAYKKAAEYPTSPIYGFAVYKQGWCFLNTGDYDLAQEKFSEVIRISDDPSQDLDQKGRMSLRKEALKDYVRAYSYVGDAKEAQENFRKLGGDDAVQGMLESLGQWYGSRDGHADVIRVYRDLIKGYPRSLRVPAYQGRVVDAASRLGEPKATIAQAKLLTDYFSTVRERVKKGDLSDKEKETVKKDLKEAEDIAENTLRRLATEYYQDGRKLKGRAAEQSFRYANDLFRHYLTVFPTPKPDAEVNYVFFMRFYYADVLYRLEEFQPAAENYDLVVDMNPKPKDKREKDIVMAAAEESVRSWDELVQDLDRKNPPEISGREPKPIPAEKQALIKSCNRYISFVGSEGDKIVEIRYKMARINYEYNHFEVAAPAFLAIVQNHPKHDVACYAANLALDIYNGEKNYRALRDATRTYLASNDLPCTAEDRVKFTKIEEQSSFLMIKAELEEQKKYVQAGNAYMEFYRTYPKSEFSDDAVFNTTVNYDLGNRLDKANEVREFFVKTFPESPHVPETMYNIALSYERVADFTKAAEYFERFADKYPEDKRSKDAIYNAGLYRATLLDFEGSKKLRNKYIDKYKGDAENPEVAFKICESIEQEAELLEEAAKKKGEGMPIKKWEAAHDCYLEWVKKSDYTKALPDLWCQAEWRRGEIMRVKTKYDKGVEAQEKSILGKWPEWKKRGADKMPRCSTAVAEIKFRSLRGQFARYSGLKIEEINPTEKGKKKFEASVTAKVKARDELIELYKGVAEIGVAEWALAALFQIGELYRDTIDEVLKAPVPSTIQGIGKLDDDTKKILKEELRKMTLPIEEDALTAYRLCVNKAQELGVYNSWSVKALDNLQRMRPEEYPPLAERIPEVKFVDPVVVTSSGVVLEDGDSYKLLPQKLQAGVGPPDESGGKAKDGKDGKDGDKGKGDKGDGKTPTPEPVDEGKKPGKKGKGG